MGGGGGKTTSTTVVNVPPPTAEELDDKAIARAINKQNLWDSGFEMFKNEAGAYETRKRELTPEEQQQKDFDAKLKQQIQQRLMGGPVDDETKALVDQTFDASRDLGNEEISRFMREQAGARGMDMATDTPMLKELGLAKSRFETGLGGARSASLLDSGNRQQIFAAQLNEFQNNLRQQSFLNRSMIGESYMQNAMGLARERQQSAGQTQIGRGGGGGGGSGQLIGAGVGAAGAIGAAMISSASFF